MFKKKDKKPRIAFREQRNGVREYYVQVWASYPSGSMWSQESKTTRDIEEAKRLLKKITDEEIIGHGVLSIT